jgi:hypothetical protein
VRRSSWLASGQGMCIIGTIGTAGTMTTGGGKATKGMNGNMVSMKDSRCSTVLVVVVVFAGLSAMIVCD